jgi:glycosyltransferase involved in cell wall biosynthesis
MPRLSVCVITRDEAANIEACLRSVAFADEWIVVDSGSTDGTREIARAAGARVIERAWTGYVDQKNFALDQAAGEWVLFLDADERVSDALRAAILAVLDASDAKDGYTMPLLTRYLGRWIRHGGWYPDRKLRLFRRGRGRWVGGDVHERAEVDGSVGALDGDLLHYSYASIADHLVTIDRYTTLSAEQKHRAGARAGPVSLVLRPAAKFAVTYVLRRGFLDGVPGLVVAVTGAFYVFLKYAKLWELRLRSGQVAAGPRDA